MTRCCVYTVLYGQDETLPEQPIRASSAVDFIAFVGDPNLTSDTWQMRHLPPLLPDDPVRSSRYVKMHPHVLLPDYDASLYIDCSVLLRRPPEAFFAALLFGRTDTMAMLRHCQRDRIADEAEAVVAWNYDDPLVIAEQMRAYALDGHTGAVPLMWGGLLLRFHNEPRVVRCMETWFAHVMAFSRRDQLAFPHVAEKLGFDFHQLDFDTRDSQWHLWPIDPFKQRAPWRPMIAAPAAPAPQTPERRLWDVAVRLDTLGAAAIEHPETLRAPTPVKWVPPSELPVATVALRDLRARLRGQRDTLATAAADVASLRGELAEARHALDEARSNMDAVAARLAAVHRSTSWRITAPLRRCVEMLRRRSSVR